MKMIGECSRRFRGRFCRTELLPHQSAGNDATTEAAGEEVNDEEVVSVTILHLNLAKRTWRPVTKEIREWSWLDRHEEPLNHLQADRCAVRCGEKDDHLLPDWLTDVVTEDNHVSEVLTTCWWVQTGSDLMLVALSAAVELVRTSNARGAWVIW